MNDTNRPSRVELPDDPKPTSVADIEARKRGIRDGSIEAPPRDNLTAAKQKAEHDAYVEGERQLQAERDEARAPARAAERMKAARDAMGFHVLNEFDKLTEEQRQGIADAIHEAPDDVKRALLSGEWLDDEAADHGGPSTSDPDVQPLPRYEWPHEQGVDAHLASSLIARDTPMQVVGGGLLFEGTPPETHVVDPKTEPQAVRLAVTAPADVNPSDGKRLNRIFLLQPGTDLDAGTVADIQSGTLVLRAEQPVKWDPVSERFAVGTD